jgi:hypothetical protein
VERDLQEELPVSLQLDRVHSDPGSASVVGQFSEQTKEISEPDSTGSLDAASDPLPPQDFATVEPRPGKDAPVVTVITDSVVQTEAAVTILPEMDDPVELPAEQTVPGSIEQSEQVMPQEIGLPVARPKLLPTDRVVATVGIDVVSLSQLTDAVKLRLSLMPADKPPTRKQIIALARAVLEGLIENSLVMQEANHRYTTPEGREFVENRIQKQLIDHDLPNLIRASPHARDASSLDLALASQGLSVSLLRERNRVLKLAQELAGQDPQAKAAQKKNVKSYIAMLQQRYPITSEMTPGEIAVAAGDPRARQSTDPELKGASVGNPENN